MNWIKTLASRIGTVVFVLAFLFVGMKALLSEGDVSHPLLLFAPNAVNFEGMWLEEENTDFEMLQNLAALFEHRDK